MKKKQTSKEFYILMVSFTKWIPDPTDSVNKVVGRYPDQITETEHTKQMTWNFNTESRRDKAINALQELRKHISMIIVSIMDPWDKEEQLVPL